VILVRYHGGFKNIYFLFLKHSFGVAISLVKSPPQLLVKEGIFLLGNMAFRDHEKFFFRFLYISKQQRQQQWERSRELDDSL
jgi:hypothetical protein